MQNKKIKTEIIMLPVPAELFLEAGMFEGDPMQMYADGHKIVIENIDDPKDIVCDGDCISIHAPLAGCDRSFIDPGKPPGNFNPRTPCGVRRYRFL